jgi:nitrite reductase/ring-hydroxylating ferredoxin subunit
MLGRKYKWIKIAGSESDLVLNPESIGSVDIQGEKVSFSKFGDQWYGFASHCPHAGALLAEGYIDSSGCIVCPVHSYKFSIRNGRNAEGEDFRLKTYPVECRTDGVFIGIEEDRKWKWPGFG